MRRPRRILTQVKPIFAVVVDGETEVWYLQMLKRNEQQLRIDIEPKLPQRKSIKEQYELVKDLAGREYPNVFWLVDLDALLKEHREAPKGRKTSLQAFIEYRSILRKRYKNVAVIVTNPCLEFWFLLHFERTSKMFDTCGKVESELKKHVHDYEKTQKYFTKQDNDIYLKMRPFLKTAIANAVNLGTFDIDQPTKAVCEMYTLFLMDELKNNIQVQ